MSARPQTIGPYTLGERLGAGGMGEVYQAYDERLDRWVAIKLVRSEHLDKPTVRERFRREARAAAGLSHPAIVQIHDIVESDESDAIVMELVDGEPLSSRIARGPLPVGEATRISREIAEGLAAAHAKGLIHRDLKPENVMIAADGRAKILDFGLAKRPEGEAALTADQRVLGTFRSMSPEQARGLPLDARSDLFAFGLLVYEMLTGRSPFEGSSTLETLTRICTQRQTPLREVNPAVPAPLSDLVDHLLEKEPARRPGGAREVAAALGTAGDRSYSGPTQAEPGPPWMASQPMIAGDSAARGSSSHSYGAGRPAVRWAIVLGLLLVLGAFLLWRTQRPVAPARLPTTPIYVAVAKPKINSGAGEDVELLAAGLRLALLQGLLSFAEVRPLDPQQSDEVAGTPREIARALGVGEVVTSELDCASGVCQVSLRRVAGNDGRLLWTGTFSASTDQGASLPEAVQGYLKEAYKGWAVNAPLGPLEVRPEDYAEYLRLRRDYDSRQGHLAVDPLLGKLADLRRSSPRFLEPFLFEAELRQQRYTEGRNPDDLAEAARLLAAARDLAPRDPRPLLSEFGVDFTAGRLEAAEKVLGSLDALLPGDPRVSRNRARLLQKRGDPEKALEVMTQALQRQPSWRNLFYTAGMEYHLGRIAAARAHYIEVLERSPGKYEAQSRLAQIEMFNGSPAKAVELYRNLLQRSSETTELSNLAYAYMLLGRWVDAEATLRQALAADPKSPFVQLNLADVLLYQGQPASALALYRQALAATAEDSSDPEILSTRAQALARLSNGPAAIAATQRLLRLAPDSPQAAYDVALVYLLLGDRASALFNATRALEHGMEPRFFSLPWLSPILADPQFHSLLERRSRERSL
jgi:tetratricopeptide (TPR) repeat protein/tRNA A-37 threonylcarbamoyl transferase component Bud32